MYTLTMKTPVVALCGPSGVGKSFTKKLIAEDAERQNIALVEPVVVTTRLARPDDTGSRRAGLSEGAFMQLVEAGEVVLPHQPFRRKDTPWYGFDRQSVAGGPLLTEVHSSILPEFARFFAARPVLILGLVAGRTTLEQNIHERQGTFSDGVDAAIRVDMAALEEEEIQNAFAAGLVRQIAECSPGERDAAQMMIAKSALNHVLYNFGENK